MSINLLFIVEPNSKITLWSKVKQKITNNENNPTKKKKKDKYVRTPPRVFFSMFSMGFLWCFVQCFVYFMLWELGLSMTGLVRFYSNRLKLILGMEGNNQKSHSNSVQAEHLVAFLCIRYVSRYPIASCEKFRMWFKNQVGNMVLEPRPKICRDTETIHSKSERSSFLLFWMTSRNTRLFNTWTPYQNQRKKPS